MIHLCRMPGFDHIWDDGVPLVISLRPVDPPVEVSPDDVVVPENKCPIHFEYARPKDVTAADIDLWEQKLFHWKSTTEAASLLGPVADVMWTDRRMREAWYSGEWLTRCLTQEGASKTTCFTITFACGQRQLYVRDPWVSAVDALERFKRGEVDTPGLELANHLINEHTLWRCSAGHIFNVDTNDDEVHCSTCGRKAVFLQEIVIPSSLI